MALSVEIAEFFSLISGMFLLLPLFIRNVIYFAVTLPIVVSLLMILRGGD